MVPTSNLLAFAALVVVIIAIPGPSVMFTITRALTVGRRAALMTVLGNAAGLCVQVLAVAVGLGALVQDSALAFAVLKFVGAAYIVYLGVQAILHRHSLAESLDRRATPVPARRAARDGFLVGATNPKTIAVLVSITPSFTAPAAGHLPLQLLLLGSLLPATACVLDSVWAVAAGTVRQWLARSARRMDLIGGAGGAVMIGIGAGLALTGRKD